MTERASPSLALGESAPHTVEDVAHITAITASARHAGRFEILVEREVVATLSLDGDRAPRHSHWRADSRMRSRGAWRRRPRRSTPSIAPSRCSPRVPRAARDLERLLLRKGEPAEQVDRAIDRLARSGSSTTPHFARQFTRAKARGGLSRRRVQQELWRRGVAREVVDAAIAEVFVEERWTRAQIAAVGRGESFVRCDPPGRRHHAPATLWLSRAARFESEEIRAVLIRLGDEEWSCSSPSRRHSS